MTNFGSDALVELRAESAANEAEALSELIAGVKLALDELRLRETRAAEADSAGDALGLRDPQAAEMGSPDEALGADILERAVALRQSVEGIVVGGRADQGVEALKNIGAALDSLFELQMHGGGFGAPRDAVWERGSVRATAAVLRAALATVAGPSLQRADGLDRAATTRALEMSMAWLLAAWSEEGFGECPGAIPDAACTDSALAALLDYQRVVHSPAPSGSGRRR